MGRQKMEMVDTLKKIKEMLVRKRTWEKFKELLNKRNFEGFVMVITIVVFYIKENVFNSI